MCFVNDLTRQMTIEIFAVFFLQACSQIDNEIFKIMLPNLSVT